MKNHIALRLFLAINLLISAGALADRWERFAVLSALLFLGSLVALADTVISDILPVRFTLKAVENRRHVLYVVLAALCITAALTLAIHGTANWLMARLLLDATLACWSAVMDVKHRYVLPRLRSAHAQE